MDSFLKWVVGKILETLNPTAAKIALVTLLRTVSAALVAAAAKTDPAKYGAIAAVDDVLAAKFKDLVEEIAKALGVP